MAGKTDADILAQHFAEAGFKSAAPVGEVPKGAPKTEEVKAEEPPAPPPAPEVQVPSVTFTAPEVPKTKEEIGTNIEALTKQAEEFHKANDFDNYNAAMQSIGQHETELRRIGAEEMAAQPKAPEAKVTTPEAKVTTPEAPAVTPAAEPHFAESILGLKPVKNKLSLYQKLLAHDINTPEGREAITDLLHKTTARIAPEKLATLQKRMEEIDAQQKSEAGPPDGGSGAQPIIREEGRDQAVSSQGMEPSGQGVEAPKVSGEKVQVPEEKVGDFIARVAEMQKSKAAKQKAEDEALIRQVSEDEHAGYGGDGEPEELRFAKLLLSRTHILPRLCKRRSGNTTGETLLG